MKNNLKRLAVIMRIFPEGTFYSIGMHEYGITLQGKYSADTVRLARKLKFTNGRIDSSGYAEFSRGNIELTLT